jgi:signal peptidase I
MKAFRVIGQPILIAMVLALGVRSAVRIFAIPTRSMEPTLRVGDHIAVMPYRTSLPQRGDVVVFHSPLNRDELLVKRVVAVPGDLVESREGHLLVGGHAAGEAGSVAAQIVPAECYFVLGDNRANSYDSRQWGVLSRDLIVGRARLVLWSSGSGAMEPQANAAPRRPSPLPSPSLRFERLFKPIQ